MCKAIKELEQIEFNKKNFSVRETNQVRVKNRLVRLIGEKPLMKCELNDVKSEGLLDSGSQVSMVSLAWFRHLFPEKEVLSVEKFLEGDDLHLYAANKTKVDFEGVAKIKLSVGNKYCVEVPFIVCKEELSQPIIGYNVMKHMIKTVAREDLPKVLMEVFPFLDEAVANSVISVVNSDVPQESAVWAVDRLSLPPHSRCRVKCRTKLAATTPNETVIFSPEMLETELEMTESVSTIHLGRTPTVHVIVTNPTNQEKVIHKGMVLGSVETVSSVVPIAPQAGAEKGLKAQLEKTPTDETEVDKKCPVNIDLSHLSLERQEYVREALQDVYDVFQTDEQDIGDIRGLQMEIALTDHAPVNVPHRSIPRHLYDEVKNYVNDLIANQWVRESKSNYSSPIVCVRKRDQALRLCIDYRMLNRKIVPDRQPIPRIQELLDSLGGQKWFSSLDMGKAYHQGYIKEEFRKMTAFSTPWGLYEWIGYLSEFLMLRPLSNVM